MNFLDRTKAGPAGRKLLLAIGIALILLLPGGAIAGAADRPLADPSLRDAAPTPARIAPELPVADGAPPPLRNQAPPTTTDLPLPSLGPARPGIVPYSWRGLATPPGAEALDALHAPAGSTLRGPDDVWSSLDRFCYGVWPSWGGQAQYLKGCYGHDEPGIAGYSTIPGSGGNATWTTTLPVGGTGAATQSQLYTAIWYGMPLTDPFAWLDVCFLELQFYPDSSWTSSSATPNNWIAAAVGWQIEASNGAEDPCFYQELTLNGSSDDYLNMHGGDSVVVKMIGWETGGAGEYLQVLDRTDHELSALHLYNGTGHYPLDPAYGTASYPNSLQWTPGGELPVTFSFETGHPANGPNNNSYGGCSAGWPPPTPQDPAVPCPSYDPGSWLNNTVSPYEISPPTFFNATASETASQVAFTQDLGGIAFIDPISNGKCTGRDGSSWCSYPWYSYSCDEHAFNFGATDWPSTSTDFGEYREYATSVVTDRGGFGYYPPTNFSVPSCGGPSANVTAGASGDGSVFFLNGSIPTNATFDGLLPGEYSIAASANVGASFSGWSVTGNVAVASSTAPTTSLVVAGAGRVTAAFVAGPATPVAVRFLESNASGTVQLSEGVEGAVAPPARTVSAGSSVDLAPGIYSILALPPPGQNFTNWWLVSGAALVASTQLPYTWLTVLGGTGGIVLQANSTPSGAEAEVFLNASYYDIGTASGAISFDGSTYASPIGFSLPVGTYAVAEHPAAGSVVDEWYFGGDEATLDSGNTTFLTLEAGATYVDAGFAPAVNVTLDDAGGLGAIAFGGGAWSPDGTAVAWDEPPSEATLAADPPAGEAFLDWTTSGGANLTVAAPADAVTTVEVNGSGTITAHYASATALGVAFAVGPVARGAIELDARSYLNGTSDGTLAGGLYLATFVPGPMESFRSWTLSGGLVAVNPTTIGWPSDQQIVNLTGGSATLTAVTRGVDAPVSLFATPAGVGLSFVVNGSAVPSSGTALLPLGPVNVTLHGSAGARDVLGWWTTGNLSVTGANSTRATLFVNGSGAVYVSTGSALRVAASATPQDGGAPGNERAPLAVDFVAATTGGRSPYSDYWKFGDGGSALGPVTNHTYGQPGIYPWSVLVQDNGGNMSTATGVIVVGGAPLQIRPIATPLLGEPPLDVRVTTAVSGGASPYAVAWWVPSLNLSATGPVLNLTISTPGGFDVVANVTDAEGFLSEGSVIVNVEAPVVVQATASVLKGYAPLLVKFAADAQNGWGAVNFSWTFGDGSVGNGTVVDHTYATTGNFSATVVATDSLGATSAQTFHIDALPPLAPLTVRLTATPASIVLGNVSSILANVSGGLKPYVFDYPSSGQPPGCSGPGVVSYACQPVTAGTYTIVVIVTDQQRHNATASTTLTVLAAGGSKAPLPGPPASTSGGLPVSTLLAIGALIAVAILAGAAFFSRRRPPSRPDAPPAEPLEEAPVDLSVPASAWEPADSAIEPVDGPTDGANELPP